jgi:hypothetical protein
MHLIAPDEKPALARELPSIMPAPFSPSNCAMASAVFSQYLLGWL